MTRRIGLSLAILVLTLLTLASVRRVDVGGHRLALDCRGRGLPVVVMDAGLGDSRITWDWVRPAVSALTRVCVYDRAGLGGSDPGPEPRTSGRIVEELRALLTRSATPGPYVLVGHSFGGMTVRLYASRHPTDVAGLVLVDPTPESYPARATSLHAPADLRKMESSLSLGPAGARGEWAALEESTRELAAAGTPPLMPTRILVAQPAEHPTPSELAWLAMQRDLAARIPGSRLVIATGSSHYIQFERPELVAQTIGEVVEEVRSGTVRPDALNGSRPGSGPNRP